MLDTQDITVLKEMFTSQEMRLLGKMQEQEDRLLGTMQVQLQDAMQTQEVRLLGTMQTQLQAQDGRLIGMMRLQEVRLLAAMKQNNSDLKHEIRDEMHSLISASEERITTNIAELLDTSVLPQIADLQRDMTVVKMHLQLA